jgi:hypothetical protein
MSERSSTYMTPHLDYGTCMAVNCHLRAYYRTATSRFCAFHWRNYLLAKVGERQQLGTPELKLWMQFIRMASTPDVLTLLSLCGDVMIGQVDDIDRRTVAEIIESAKSA